MAPPTTDTALAVITTSAEFQTALARLQERCNLLTPFTNIGGLAPQHAIVTTTVAINPDKAAGDVYDGVTATGTRALTYLKPDEVALAKNGLRKIAEGLGISIHLEYPSAGQVNYYWHVKAIAAYRGLDGAWVQREASEEWNLRDGSDRIRGWTANQLAEGRKHGLRQCETRAINAVIRECGCGVKQVYHKSDLQKPFVAFRVTFVPDMNDADQRRAVTDKYLQGASALYAPQMPAASFTSGGDAFTGTDGEVIDTVPVGRTSTPVTTLQTPATTPAAADDTPPTPYAVRIVDIKEKSGVKERTGRRWVKWDLIDSNGETAATFDAKIHEAAVTFRRDGTWVEIDVEENGQYRNVTSITVAGREPRLPNMDEV